MRIGRIALACALAWSLASPAGAVSREDILHSDAVLSLRDAIQLALENNLSLAVSRTEPALARLRIDESTGSYEPLLFGGASYDRSKNPIANPVLTSFGTSGNTIVEDLYDYNGGVRGVLPWGPQYSTFYDLRRLESSSSFTSLEPEWRAAWITELRVPLLRDLFWNQVDLQVRRSYVQRDITDEDFRGQLIDTITEVENRYWELRATRETQRVAEKSIETARAVLEQTQVQYEVGVVSKVNVAQSEAGLADREFRAILAKNRADAAQDSLLDLILAPGHAEFEATRLRAQDPTFVAYVVDAAAAMQRALAQRPELQSARKRVEDAELEMKFAWNQRLPSVDLVGSYASNALAGEEKPGVAKIAGIRSGGVNDNLFKGDSGSYTIGAEVEIPLGNRVASSRYTQSKINLRRARTLLRQTEQQITLDVRNAVRNLRSSIDGVKAAERRVAAEAESLRAEEERLRLGDSTPREVLEVEEDLAEAEQQEIVALQSYVNAITALERAQATLLETRNVSLGDELNR